MGSWGEPALYWAVATSPEESYRVTCERDGDLECKKTFFFFYDVATGELYHQEIRTHPKLSWKGVALGLHP